MSHYEPRLHSALENLWHLNDQRNLNVTSARSLHPCPWGTLGLWCDGDVAVVRMSQNTERSDFGAVTVPTAKRRAEPCNHPKFFLTDEVIDSTPSVRQDLCPSVGCYFFSVDETLWKSGGDPKMFPVCSVFHQNISLFCVRSWWTKTWVFRLMVRNPSDLEDMLVNNGFMKVRHCGISRIR